MSDTKHTPTPRATSEWQQADRDEITRLRSENAKLRNAHDALVAALKAIMGLSQHQWGDHDMSPAHPDRNCTICLARAALELAEGK